MNVDDMTDEEFIDYCRNGGELSGLITERHPKCDWCGCTYRVGRDGMCRNCRVRERRRTDPEYAQHLRDLANRQNRMNNTLTASAVRIASNLPYRPEAPNHVGR